jgi:hypothetical protein
MCVTHGVSLGQNNSKFMNKALSSTVASAAWFPCAPSPSWPPISSPPRTAPLRLAHAVLSGSWLPRIHIAQRSGAADTKWLSINPWAQRSLQPRRQVFIQSHGTGFPAHQILLPPKDGLSLDLVQVDYPHFLPVVYLPNARWTPHSYKYSGQYIYARIDIYILVTVLHCNKENH